MAATVTGPTASVTGPVGPPANNANPEVATSGGSNPGGAPAANPAPASSSGITQPIAPLPVLASAEVAAPAAGAPNDANPAGAQGPRPQHVGQGAPTSPEDPKPAPPPAFGSSIDGVLAILSKKEARAVLAESLPVDLAALDRAFDQCLGQLDAMGDSLADLVTSDGVWPWVASAAVASTAGVVASYWHRKARFDPLAADDGEAIAPSWFLDSISRT